MTALSSPLHTEPSTVTTDAAPSLLARRLFLFLGAVALLYALLAGLRTVSDPDLGWQLATGRWIAEHHQIPSTDVFSYTAQGQPWIYPVGSGLLFYLVYLMGGYTLLSLMGAATCVGTVALLLRRSSAFTAAMAILAVPLIAERTSPRADIFTVILFAAYLSILWQYYKTGRAPLWLLPVLMLAWVNLHLGFVAGLALIAAFAGMEVLELFSPAPRRHEALRRIRKLAVCFAATAVATLVNPWGWGVYQAIIRQERVMGQHSSLIAEWANSSWNWSGSLPSFSQNPGQHTLTLLMLVVVIAAGTALLQVRLGPAILLLGAMYESAKHIRMEALTACVVVIVAGGVLADLAAQLSSRIPNRRMTSIAAIAAAALLAALACVHAAGYVDDRVYAARLTRSNFGMGAAWIYPQRAAEFVDREGLPANIFNSYNHGGYLAWKVGPKYRDYIDGRAIPFGAEALPREERLLGASLDSSDWQQETDRYNINTVILPIDGLEIAFEQLQDLCHSAKWAPVYLDEQSIVLLRRAPENDAQIRRLQVDCANATIPATPSARDPRSHAQWVNSAYVLFALRRNAEALSATDTALKIFPDNARLRRVRGSILLALYRRTEAEQEWLKSLALEPGDAGVWAQLAELYEQQERRPEALHAWQETVKLTADAAAGSNAASKLTRAHALLRLARLYVIGGQPRAALQALDESLRVAPEFMLNATSGRSFKFDVAQGRAAAYRALNDLPQATAFQEEAVKLDPEASDAWAHLARLYQRQGRVEDQQRAEQRAKALAASQTPPSP